MQEAFSHYEYKSGFVGECDRNFPSNLYAWDKERMTLKKEGSSFFGFVQEGFSVVRDQVGNHTTLRTGMYFSFHDYVYIEGGKGIIIERENHKSFNMVGGEVEDYGRLKYIDGCTDSLLISPVKLGDPCLNLLFFPPDIDQTEHTHPSDRIGVIYKGRGQCVVNGGEETIELRAGMIFRIHADGKHKFRTPYGESMTVIAYHPDSDFGPEDEFHPMVNRTIVNGVSASLISEIRTK